MYKNTLLQSEDENHQFIMQVLQAFSKSNGNPQVIYSLLEANLDKIKPILAQSLYEWGEATLPKLPSDQAKVLARGIHSLSNRLQQFALGNRSDNLEIAIAGYQVICKHVFTRSNKPAEWATVMNNLGTTYRNRISGERKDNLDRAIHCFQASLEIRTCSSKPMEWAQTTMNLGNAYLSCISGDRSENLEQAIQCYQSALEIITPYDMPIDWSQTMTNLGSTYLQRIKGKRIENLEQAIQYYQNALQVLTYNNNPIQWSGIMMNLGSAYQDRIYGEQAENLEQAIAHYQQALVVNTRSAMPVEWSEIMMNLGNTYQKRIRGERAINQEQAIQYYEKALQVRTRSAMPIEWATVMNNLGESYRKRIRGNQQENLEQAIVCFRLAMEVRTCSAMPIDWSVTMMNLGNAYVQRILGEQTENLEQAIACYQATFDVRTLSALPTEWAQTMNNLGVVYLSRINGTWAENLEQAITCFQQALVVRTPEALPEDCRKTAHSLGQILLQQQRFPEALDTFHLAIQSDHLLYQTTLSWASKATTLSEARGLYPIVAYAAARCQNMQESVVLLEQGRTRMIGEAMARDRANLDELHSQHAELAQRYQDAAQIVRNLELTETRRDSETPIEGADQVYLRHAEAMREAQAELQKAVEEIRHIPGYEAFLTLPNWESIAASVQPGLPLIYLATVEVGSLAIIVHTPTAEAEPTVTPVWLDQFTESVLLTLLRGEGDKITPDSWIGAYGQYIDVQAWFTAMERVTNALWEPIMQPLIQQLQALSVTQALLIPSGFLALLPLHAAWTEQNGKRHYAMDDICFSYAPSARLLHQAQQVAATTPSDSILAIDEPKPVSANQLPSSQAETQAILVHFEQSRCLAGEAATQEAAEAALPEAHILHFAGHGATDWDDTLQSGLLMAHDNMMTVQEVLNLQLGAARMAVLSACETGIVGTQLPDEAVMLPTALMQAGFAGVVSSLWSVADASTAMLMERFYYYWRVDKQIPPEALRQAQMWMRDTTNGEKKAYYEQFIPQYGGTVGIVPEDVARYFRRAFIFKSAPADENRFGHPFYWAAFSYTGV